MQYCERCMLDAATRLLQISIEAVLDISQHIVARKHLTMAYVAELTLGRLFTPYIFILQLEHPPPVS